MEVKAPALEEVSRAVCPEPVPAEGAAAPTGPGSQPVSDGAA